MTLRPLLLVLPLPLVACGNGTIELLPPDASAEATIDGGAGDTGRDGQSASDAPAGDVTEESCGACPCGLTDCGGQCVDTTTDPNHCGSCAGSPLLHNAYCHGGVPECLPGLTLCAGSCFDFNSDPDHCGGCNATPCATGQKCENGVCSSGTCTPPLVGCAVTGRTACVDLSRGWPHCGSCSLVCAPTQYCAGGSCHDYAPATPCTACPCAADCARALPDAGAPACCADFVSGGPPLCVEGTGCTP